MQKRAGHVKNQTIILLTVMILLTVLLSASVTVAYRYLRTPEGRYQRNLNLGNRYLLAMQYEDAVKIYTKAIGIEPKKADAYVGRGDAYAGLQETELARADYVKAVQLDPGIRNSIQPKLEALPEPEAVPVPDTPAPTPSFAAAVKLPEGTPVSVQENGSRDTISFTSNAAEGGYGLASFTISLNGMNYTEDAGTLNTEAFAVDINTEDGYGNIIVNTEGENGAPSGFIYAYNSSGLIKVSAEYLVYGISSVTGSGQIFAYDRANFSSGSGSVLFFKIQEKIDGADIEKLSESPGHLSQTAATDGISSIFDGFQEGYSCTAASDMTLYGDAACQSAAAVIPAGSAIEVLARSNADRYQVNYQVSAAGMTGWIAYDDLKEISGFTHFA